MNKLFDILNQIEEIGCSAKMDATTLPSGPLKGLKITPDQIMFGDKTKGLPPDAVCVVMKFNLHEKIATCIYDKNEAGNFREVEVSFHELEKHVRHDIQQCRRYINEWQRQRKFEKAVVFSFVMQNEEPAKLFTTLYIPKAHTKNTFVTFKPTWYSGVIEVYESYFDKEQKTFVDKSMSIDEHEFIVLTKAQFELLTLTSNAQNTPLYPKNIQNSLTQYTDDFTKIVTKTVCTALKERAFSPVSFSTEQKVTKRGTKTITKYYKPTLCIGVFEVSTGENPDHTEFVRLSVEEFNNMNRQELDL